MGLETYSFSTPIGYFFRLSPQKYLNRASSPCHGFSSPLALREKSCTISGTISRTSKLWHYTTKLAPISNRGAIDLRTRRARANANAKRALRSRGIAPQPASASLRRAHAQNFLTIFCGSSPDPSAERRKRGKEIFWGAAALQPSKKSDY